PRSLVRSPKTNGAEGERSRNDGLVALDFGLEQAEPRVLVDLIDEPTAEHLGAIVFARRAHRLLELGRSVAGTNRGQDSLLYAAHGALVCTLRRLVTRHALRDETCGELLGFREVAGVRVTCRQELLGLRSELGGRADLEQRRDGCLCPIALVLSLA